MKLTPIFIFICVLILSSCVPAEEKEYTNVNIQISNSDVQRVLNFQNEQNLDSLRVYLSSRNPTLRYLSALAFASFQEPEIIDSLSALLNDPSKEVREVTAYALGQIKDPKAETILLKSFQNADSNNINTKVNENILEAIGKCGSDDLLNALSTVTTYRLTDNHLLNGQAKAIYRYALRGITDPAGTKKMVDFVIDNQLNPETRLIASNYLYRARDIDISEYKFQLSKVFNTHPDPRIRMTLAMALGKSGDREILNILMGQLSTEDDYRVKCNIIRALDNFEYIDVIERILNLLSDKNHHISQNAAQYLINNGEQSDAAIYAGYIDDQLHWRTRALTYHAILKHLPSYYTNTRNKYKNDIKRLFSDSPNPYEKAALVQAIGQDINDHIWVKDNTFADTASIVRIAGIQAFNQYLKSDRFQNLNRGLQRYHKRLILRHLQEAFQLNDQGMTAIASGMVSDESLGYKELIRDPSFLDSAKADLKLPNDIETYQILEKTIAYVKDLQPPEPIKLNQKHAIDWSLLEGLSDSSRAYIFTPKGKITLKFYPKFAPASVANFITLANSGFYDGKTIHRVVPNFVIQGGCPRGDGYGNLDYTICSELAPLNYFEQGMVGMASAGIHTESSQWFITHSPTPHLDGNYTIFAQVVAGMEVIHEIEIGDKIDDIRILKL